MLGMFLKHLIEALSVWGNTSPENIDFFQKSKLFHKNFCSKRIIVQLKPINDKENFNFF